MPKLNRYFQKIFGSTANPTEISTFGSLAAGSPAYTTDPSVIQSLANYLRGWYGGVVGGYSPTIEDMNALFYLLTYQVSYLMQEGIPEWDANTEYYIGSVAQDGNGNLYRSITNANTGNALTNPTHWRGVLVTVQSINPATTPSLVLTGADNGKTFLVNTANGTCAITLPPASSGYLFKVADSAGLMDANPVTITRAGSEQIEGLGANFLCESPWGSYSFVSDGTNWFLVG